MSQEKEGIRQMFGKPCGCVGKPEQDSNRGAEGAQGHLLPQTRMKLKLNISPQKPEETNLEHDTGGGSADASCAQIWNEDDANTPATNLQKSAQESFLSLGPQCPLQCSVPLQRLKRDKLHSSQTPGDFL